MVDFRIAINPRHNALGYVFFPIFALNRIIMKRIVLVFIVCCIGLSLFAQADKQVVYKQIDTVSLMMDIYFPQGIETSDSHPAMVFFFGGGWNGGTVKQFEEHAKYYAGKGIVCFLAQYRVKNTHGTTPFESLEDAKSAVRFIRENAKKFKINPEKIIASGGSAGGHLAAATALIEGYDDEGDDLSISCIPNALVLFNPVIDNGPGGYGFERIGSEYKDFSPLHNIMEGAPPTLFLVGTNDNLIPVETAKYYQKVMETVGSRCDLKLYEGKGHGWFNYRNLEDYKETIEDVDGFLESMGYLL